MKGKEMDIEVKNYIAIDFSPIHPRRIDVFVKQGDENSRYLIISPLVKGMPFAVDDAGDVKPYFAAHKPDGKYVYNDGVQILENGALFVTLSDQTLVAHGEAECCIVLESQDKNLTSQNFYLNIEYSPGAYSNLASTDEILDLDEKIKKVDEIIERAEEIFSNVGEISIATAKYYTIWLPANNLEIFDPGLAWNYDTATQKYSHELTKVKFDGTASVFVNSDEDLANYGFKIYYDETKRVWVAEMDNQFPDMEEPPVATVLFIPCTNGGNA